MFFIPFKGTRELMKDKTNVKRTMHISSRATTESTRVVIAFKRRHTNTTTKTGVAYGNSHLACE